MATVTVACSARNGLILGPDAFGNRVVLAPGQAGVALPKNAPTISLTQVDSGFWANWAVPNNALVANYIVWQVS